MLLSKALSAIKTATSTAIGATLHTCQSCHSIMMRELKLLIIDSITAGDASILLPVQDGVLANCQRAKIKFARVQLNLNFIMLVTLRPPGNTILQTKYYIKLPQASCDLTNGNNQAYCLMTYLGPGDLRAIAAADFELDILAHTLQDGPIDLLLPTFNLTAARLDRTTLVSEICNKIIMLATPLVLNCLFNQLCPKYSKEPHAALDHIRQTYEDAEGNIIFQPVFDYHWQILSASRPFIDHDLLPISICQIFIDGLDTHLIKRFCTHFPNYSTSQSLAAIHQRNTLEQMMQAAVKAESQYNSVRAIAIEAVGGAPGQAFQAKVNASQAKRTLTQYGTGGDIVLPRPMDALVVAPSAASGVAGPTLGCSLKTEPMLSNAPVI
jgi:hypothetical protein